MLYDLSSGGKDLDRWFVEEVLPLENSLVRFLRSKWHNKSEIPDLVQDVFVHTYAAARRERPHLVKSFMFQTARNLMIDRLRRRNIVSIEAVADFDDFAVPADEPTPEECVAVRQELRLLQDALDSLPRRCREVVVLRKVYGYSQREVAERTGVSEVTVESQLSKGLHRLVQSVRNNCPALAVRVKSSRAFLKLGKNDE